jgi:UDP-N-acetylglucosamine acyltransferase
MSESSQWRVDGRGNRIHKTALLGEDISLGSNNTVGALSVIGGLGCSVVIGDQNSIGVGSVIGSPPENAGGCPGSAHLNVDYFARSRPSLFGSVRIGSRCVIRDKVTIHGGIDGPTNIGDLNYLHTGTHLDHNVTSEAGVVFAPKVVSAGHVSFGAFSQIGLGACFHQGARVGALAMVGMNATVKGKVPDMSLHFGSPSRLRGANAVRLRRLGLATAKIAEIEELLSSDVVAEDERQLRLSEILHTLIDVATSQALRAWEGQL